MRIGYNVHGQNIPDAARLEAHIRALRPRAMLFMDALGEAQRYKAMFPDMLVIYREHGEFGDESIHLRETPEKWLARRAPMAAGGIYQYTTNEPGFDDACINWHIELMELAAARRVPLVVGNWAVGNPPADSWPKALRLLQLLDRHRDLFVLGLHEYAGAVITSGLHGGYPDRAGVAPDDMSKPGLNLIPPQNWPSDVRNVTMFHCGRFNFLVRYCQSVGIKPPRIILTEHGMDDLSDIRGFMAKLKTDPRYHNARGWKSIVPQWAEWWRGWPAERAYFEQLRWADEVIYRNSVVEAQLIFSWGHSSQIWEQFDVAEAREFQSLLEGYAREQTTPVVAEPPLPSLPPLPAFPAGFAARARKATLLALHGAVTVHESLASSSPVVHTLTNGAIALIIPPDDLRPDERIETVTPSASGCWIPVQIGAVRGWLFAPLVKIVLALPSHEAHNATLVIRVTGLTIEQARALANKAEFTVEVDGG